LRGKYSLSRAADSMWRRSPDSPLEESGWLCRRRDATQNPPCPSQEGNLFTLPLPGRSIVPTLTSEEASPKWNLLTGTMHGICGGSLQAWGRKLLKLIRSHAGAAA
jgi:hypothetical protein